MNGIEVGMPTLTKTFGISLGKCIDEAADSAREAVACGESVRWIHGQGCTNSSRASTSVGVISTADDLIRSTLVEDDESRPFGNNLRSAWRTLKPLFNR